MFLAKIKPNESSGFGVLPFLLPRAPVTTYAVGPDFLVSSLFSSTLKQLCSFLNARVSFTPLQNSRESVARVF